MGLRQPFALAPPGRRRGRGASEGGRLAWKLTLAVENVGQVRYERPDPWADAVAPTRRDAASAAELQAAAGVRPLLEEEAYKKDRRDNHL